MLCTAAATKLLQSCLTPCDPIDGSPPGSSVHGSLQTRILEQIAISYSRQSSPPRNQTRISCFSCIAGRFFTTVPPGKPRNTLYYLFKPMNQFHFALSFFFSSQRIKKMNNKKKSEKQQWNQDHDMLYHPVKYI